MSSLEVLAMDDNHDDRADLLVGALAIKEFLIELGWPPKVNPYYLVQTEQWPIGRTSGGKGGHLVASKRKLRSYVARITSPR
jgi:hypothetical protein